MYRSQKDREKNLNQNREYGFKQTHGGTERFPGGEWGANSEFGRNSNYHESDSYDRPYDMDNFREGKQYVKGPYREIDSQDDNSANHEFNRSRFAEPYTGGQFARSQYGRGSNYQRDIGNPSFLGKGPKGYRRSDERIREEVCEALYRSPAVDASDIEVAVKDGFVTLSGTVESRYAKREAESCVEHLSGVEDVQNELRLKAVTGKLGAQEH